MEHTISAIDHKALRDFMSTIPVNKLIFPKKEEPKAKVTLQKALKHMEDRAQTYDKPEGERSMEKTVEAFKAITGIEMTEEQGWLFMTTLKAVRAQQGMFKADNYEDGAAYFALACEAAFKERT